MGGINWETQPVDNWEDYPAQRSPSKDNKKSIKSWDATDEIFCKANRTKRDPTTIT